MLLWVAAAFAGSEDPGPFVTGRRDFGLVDPVEGWLEGRIVYPALGAGGRNAAPDTASGPYPLVALMHGWLASPDEYDRLAEHVASWGFVVILPGTHSGPIMDIDDYAEDTAAMLDGVDTLSDQGQGWLAGLASDDPWSAVGHSMGGGTLAPLVGLEPRVETIVGLQAMESQPHQPMIAAYTGAALYVGASGDQIVPAPLVHDWFEVAGSARRNLYVEIVGGSHTGPNDTGLDGAGLTFAEEHRLNELLVVAFLRAEVFGEEDAYAEILDPAEPLDTESRCADPVLVWSAPAGLPIVTVAGAANATARIAAAAAPGSVQTPLGEVGLDPASAAPLGAVALGPDGLGELGAANATWVQARVGNALTRTVVIP